MKESQEFFSDKNVDYFDKLDKSTDKFKQDKEYKLDSKIKSKFKLNFNEDRKPRNIEPEISVETEADRRRKLEIQAAKSELYQLRTTGEAERKASTDKSISNRRAELINCKRVLSAEGDVKTYRTLHG